MPIADEFPLQVPVEVSVTAYSDRREVGCPFLNPNNGLCRAVRKIDKEVEVQCAHLLPGNSSTVQRLPVPSFQSEPPSQSPSSSHRGGFAPGTEFAHMVSIDREALRRERIARGMSLRELGLAVGMHKGSLSKLENGKFGIGVVPEVADRLRSFFGDIVFINRE